MQVLAAFFITLILASCDGSGTGTKSNSKDVSESSSESLRVSRNIVEESQVVIETAPFTIDQLCKATISAVMGASPSIMRTSEQFGSTIVAYNRESDGKLWDYMCRLDGDRVVWGRNGGRWHDHDADEDIRVSIDSKTSTLKIRMVHSDNSSERHEFNLSELE